MAGKVEVDPILFRRAAAKTVHVHDRINQVWDKLSGAISGLGQPWGNDKMGNQFAEGPAGDNGYLTTVTNLDKGATSMAGSFKETSDGQIKTATKLEEMEELSRRVYKRRGR